LAKGVDETLEKDGTNKADRKIFCEAKYRQRSMAASKGTKKAVKSVAV